MTARTTSTARVDRFALPGHGPLRYALILEEHRRGPYRPLSTWMCKGIPSTRLKERL